jgi:hypothetical protein
MVREEVKTYLGRTAEAEAEVDASRGIEIEQPLFKEADVRTRDKGERSFGLYMTGDI